MLHDLLEEGPRLWILGQALSHNIPEADTPLLRPGQARRRTPRDLEQGSHWMKVSQWWAALSHLYHGDAQRPDVALRVILSLELLGKMFIFP